MSRIPTLKVRIITPFFILSKVVLLKTRQFGYSWQRHQRKQVETPSNFRNYPSSANYVWWNWNDEIKESLKLVRLPVIKCVTHSLQISVAAPPPGRMDGQGHCDWIGGIPQINLEWLEIHPIPDSGIRDKETELPKDASQTLGHLSADHRESCPRHLRTRVVSQYASPREWEEEGKAFKSE